MHVGDCVPVSVGICVHACEVMPTIAAGFFFLFYLYFLFTYLRWSLADVGAQWLH